MSHRPQFAADEIYHVYNRGVEKRNIFLNNEDYYRFSYSLYEFNDTVPASNLWHYFNAKIGKSDFLKKPKWENNKNNLVDILCFCLMPNHYHLLVQAKTDSAVTEFMRKLGTGYTNYFNKKYERSGVLFQGKFKAVHIASDPQLMYIPHYIHLNPLDLFMPGWKTNGISSYNKALRHLKEYAWSSFHDYTGRQKFSFLLETSFIDSIFKTKQKGYEDELKRWIKDMDFDSINDITID